jgi:CBS domain containing-hemolysin-like protein
MAEVLAPTLVIVLLIAMNGLFVAAEFAIVAARRSRLATGRASESWAVRYVRRILGSAPSQDRYIAIAQLGITLATIGLGMYGEPSIAASIHGPLERAFGLAPTSSHAIATVLAVLLMTYFHVVIGEMIPKSLALQAPERTALAVARPMRLSGALFYPLVALLNGVGNALLRLFRVPSGGASRLYSPAELAFLVQESQEEGAVSEEEERLIRNILELEERQVRHVMVPRVRLQALPLDAGWEETRAFVEENRHSRHPVYSGDLDRIVGILHVKDFIGRDVRGEPVALRELIRRVPRVPEAMPVERLLESFKRLHVHMAVVLDEYGGTAGIVTLDDLLEEVVGEVEAESYADELPEVEELAPDRYRVDGSLPLHQFNERFGTELTSQESATVAGFVLERLERVPETGDTVETGPLSLRVEEVEGLTIRWILVDLPAAQGRSNE